MIELLLRVVLSLAIVLGMLWFIARRSSRRFGGSARSMVRVLARQSLARSASLAVVEVGERVLVVGVTESGVSLLTEMDPSELPTVETSPPVVEAEETYVAHPAAEASVGLAGSMLSAQTWRQAWAAATSKNGGSRG